MVYLLGTRIASVYIEELEEYVDMAVEDDNSLYFVGATQNNVEEQSVIEFEDYEIIE